MNFLAIGSIVLLKNGNKKLMIYGRFQIDVTDGEIYDYVGCLYPEGNISVEYSFLFNNEDVDEIIFEGYRDVEEEEYINSFLQSINSD